VTVLPGASTVIDWTLHIAEWLTHFWVVRVILGITVLSYVANFGLILLVGGGLLLYGLWNRIRGVPASGPTGPAGSA